MSKARFEQKLRETLAFLGVSTNAYDAGVECEALRIAVCLRVLFHDTKSSTSLAKHLGANWKIVTTDGGHKKPIGYVSLILDLGSEVPVKASPILGQKFAQQPLGIHAWWKEQVVFEHEGKSYFRSNIALAASNQDGGAHVDKSLAAFYVALASSMPLAIVPSNLEYAHGPEPFDQSKYHQAQNTHFALLRQFAHEILVSARHFNWVDMTPRPQKERNLPTGWTWRIASKG